MPCHIWMFNDCHVILYKLIRKNAYLNHDALQNADVQSGIFCVALFKLIFAGVEGTYQVIDQRVCQET